MKNLLIALSCLAVMSCSKQPESAPTPQAQSMGNLLESYYEDYLILNPLEATQIDDKRYNNILLNDISEAHRSKVASFCKQYQDSLQNYDRAALSTQDQLSYDILQFELALKTDLLKYPENLMPVQQFWGMTLTMPQLGSGKSYVTFKTVDDYEDFLGRIDGFTVWMDTAIVNMRKGLARGTTFPKILMERVLPQAKAMMVSDVKQSVFWGPIADMPATIGEKEKGELTTAYTDAIKTKIVPAYTKLYNFLKDEYIPKTRTTSGVGEIPNGKEYYQLMIKQYTTTELSPDSIFNLGKAEVARITREMEAVKEQVSFKGDLKAFFAYVNNDKKFMPYKTAQEVIDAYKAIETKIEPNLKKMFNMVPRSKFEVRQTEKFREASASAEYNLGSPDGVRPGIFYVPVPDPKTYNNAGMETLFLHEAIPGHHYQCMLQLENTELPRFRRTLGYSAYGEGWALYTESLGKELGLYTDPIQYFGHLGDEMHRAIRLVVDVGMHVKGWTREEAIKYMMENEPIAEQGAIAEIERYMAIPGQALSYKIGQLKISELRVRAEKELGDKFDLGLFHDEVLKYGNLPLSILDTRIKQWIEERKKV
ncbi:DUF885 domain-containing protein [Pseudochryseolinea flava]|uniref:DUF885 domain-containing protein n=1 Tax=Pseudochryseolinea flava TaxID=2059302 RepID=A0A364XXF8_9BACT|nr:DUF885 domain-containing protein [Pseudochryseolinea flava]RAV98088.1 DUF885 domain-containing protein [Pseudochryseolinea flava]